MSSVTVIDHGWNRIQQAVRFAQNLEVAIGIHEGARNNEVKTIARYAADNEYGTSRIPSRPFMAQSFDENISKIKEDFLQQTQAMVGPTFRGAVDCLTIIGIKQSDRIKNKISSNMPPRNAPETIAAKRGSSSTLIDTSAMINSIHPVVRPKGS